MNGQFRFHISEPFSAQVNKMAMKRILHIVKQQVTPVRDSK